MNLTRTSAKPTTGMEPRRILICCTIIACITAIAFLPSLNNGFIYWDDDSFIINNPDIKTLTFKNLVNVFTSNYVGIYQPIPMLTYMVEFHFCQLNPQVYHTTNLILHILNGLLVFVLFLVLSRRYTTSLIVSLLFAVHPMRVESVAWIAERKDVLFGFFYLISLLLYVRFIRGKHFKFYWLCLLSFLFSLLSKPMAVSLPVVLLLIDYLENKKLEKKALLSKIPFFSLLILFATVTFLIQKKTGDFSDYLQLSILQRICVPFYNLFFYVAKTIVPVHLCSLYPFPPHLSNSVMLAFYAAPFIVLGIITAVYYFRTRSRTLVFGSLFCFITLLPVLQIVPFWNAIAAERFSYIPLLGIYFIIASLCQFLLTDKLKNKTLKGIVVCGISSIIITFTFITYNRCNVWKDGLSFWNDTIAKYPTSVAYNFRGNIYNMHHDFDHAIEDYNQAIMLDPKYCQAYDNRGFVYSAKRNFDHAIADHTEAIRLDPKDAVAFNDRAYAYSSIGEYRLAVEDFNIAIKLKPTFMLFNNRGVARNALGDYKQAVEDFDEAIRLNPEYRPAFYNRAIAYKAVGDATHAIDDFNKACNMGYSHACLELSRY